MTVCPICGKVSSIIPSLRTHMRRAHNMSEEMVLAMIPPLKKRGSFDLPHVGNSEESELQE